MSKLVQVFGRVARGFSRWLGIHEADPDRAFWNWFLDHTSALTKSRSMVDVMQQVQRALNKQHRGVLAEIGPAGVDRLLVLTADGDRKLFPMILKLFAARPDVEGWKIVAFRQRESNRPMLTFSMSDRELDPATLRYVADRNEGKLDIKLYVPGYAEGEKTLGTMAFLALDHTVGEYDVETKIGGITLLPAEHVPANAHALDDLPVDVDAIGSASN